MNSNKLRCAVALLCTSAITVSAAEKVFFKEDFSRYAGTAPGISSGIEGTSIGNDPVWLASETDFCSELNIQSKKGGNLYAKDIALPSLKTVDIQFRYRTLNAKNPVNAVPEVKDQKGNVTKKAVAAVPGNPKAFDVILNKTAIRIASDSVTVNGKKVSFPFQRNGSWCYAALRINGGKLTIYTSIERKLVKQIEVPFAEPVTSLNFGVLPDNSISLTSINVSAGGKIDDNPASKYFADFRSLSQPLPKGAVKTDVSIAPDTGFAGARVRLNKANTPLEMTLTWDNGEKKQYKITAKATKESLQAAVGNHKSGETVTLPDAIITLDGSGMLQRVRSLNRLYGSGTYVPQYVDFVRDWELLPPASKHPLDLDFVTLQDGTLQIYLDASLASILKVPAKPLAKDEKLNERTPLAKLNKIEFKGNGIAEVFVKKDQYKGLKEKFYPIDLTANPRAKAFADAKLSLTPGVQTISGIPYDVAAPMDSADIGICKQGKGNWALEVDEYSARSPFDGLPSAVHYRIPASSYSKAHVLFALDPDPAKDKILTVQMTRYRNSGTGNNMVGSVTLDLNNGKIPANIKQVGTVTKDGKELPLYQADITLDLSTISDLAARGETLDLNIIGKPGENTEQLDNRAKPDPRSVSAFNLFALTLEKAPVSMDFKQTSPGNVFTEGEKALTTVVLKAISDNSTGKVQWTAKDVDGKVVFQGEKTFKLKRAKDTLEIEIPLEAGVGYYDLDVVLNCDNCEPLLHAGRFAILGKNERKWTSAESPYGTWWFRGFHGSPANAELGGPVMQKAGIRKTYSTTADTLEKYDINYDGHLSIPQGLSFDYQTGHFKEVTLKVPDPANPKQKIDKKFTGEEAFVYLLKESMNPKMHYSHVMLWHESAPGYGIPEELLNLPLPESAKKQIEQDKKTAMYINECGRILHKHFPNLRFQIGNSTSSIGAVVRPMRAGANPEYYDRIGIEISSQMVMPEKLQEAGFQGMMITKEAAKVIGKRDVKTDGCWEFIYRPARDLGEQQQAEWYMRDILISLANDFNLISIASLFDCTSAYYDHFYGATGIMNRAPYVYPKRLYVAYAALTNVLDSVKFMRQLPTGSTTVYALEFQKPDGSYAYAFWSARGTFDLELDNSANTGLFGSSDAVLTSLYGQKKTLSGKILTVSGGTAPVYLTVKKALKYPKIVKRAFPEEEARAAKAKTASSFDDASLVTLEPDPMVETHQTSFLPINKPGKFIVKDANDPDKGKAIELSLDLSSDPYKSKFIVEYTTLRLKQPALVPGKPAAIGVWIKGNSNWGQIRFEIEDAQGEIFKGITTNGWGCDIYDWPGNTCVNFDGWCYVAQPLFPTNLFCNHSPGPVSEQWVSCGGDKKIDLPVRIRAITVGMYRHKLDLLDFKDIQPSILLKNAGGVEE